MPPSVACYTFSGFLLQPEDRAQLSGRGFSRSRITSTGSSYMQKSTLTPQWGAGWALDGTRLQTRQITKIDIINYNIIWNLYSAVMNDNKAISWNIALLCKTLPEKGYCTLNKCSLWEINKIIEMILHSERDINESLWRLKAHSVFLVRCLGTTRRNRNWIIDRYIMVHSDRGDEHHMISILSKLNFRQLLVKLLQPARKFLFTLVLDAFYLFLSKLPSFWNNCYDALY